MERSITSQKLMQCKKQQLKELSQAQKYCVEVNLSWSCTRTLTYGEDMVNSIAKSQVAFIFFLFIYLYIAYFYIISLITSFHS